MSFARNNGPVALVGLWLLTRDVAAQTRLGVSFEAGAELDSNATRVPDADSPVSSPLWRMTSNLELVAHPADRQVFSLLQTTGGKMFLAKAAQSENVIVDDTHLSWSSSFASGIQTQVALDYYDAFQQASTVDPRRDFRQGSLGPHLVLLPEPEIQVVASAGYRAFQYKLDPIQDFWGPYFGAQLRKRWFTGPEEDEREWELALGYEVNARTFNGSALADINRATAADRHDLLHFGELRATWTGTILVGLAYGAQWNASNSYGFGWLRHVITARFATHLPFGLSLAARAVVQILQLTDPVLLDPSVNRGDTFENENRSSVETALDRKLSDHLRVVLRYTYITSVLGTATNVDPQRVDFSRHLGFVGLAYRYEH